jgi:hypothetical protein
MAQSGRGAGNAGGDEREHYIRSGMSCGDHASEDKNADADNAADADRRRLLEAEDATEILARQTFGLQTLN